MNQIVAYLTFNGNCREAMSFYQTCLGGELNFQTVGESPKSEKLPQGIKEYIVRASLKKGNMVLMGTDMVDENGLTHGNSISILLECNNEEEIKKYYEKLSKDGNARHPLRETFWGALFGGLTDRYGNQWLFHIKK